MADEVNIVTNYIIKKYGIFDFETFLSSLLKWFSLHKYDAIERSHSEKDTSFGKNISLEYVASRKISNYVKFNLKININVKRLQDISIESDEGLTKSQKGGIEVVFSSYMEKDLENKWNTDKGNFNKFLKNVYEKYIIDKQISNAKDKLFSESMDLIKLIKDKINL